MSKPEIRIKGFEEKWVEMPFSKMVTRVSTSGNTKDYPGVEFEDIVSGEGVLKKDVVAKNINKVGKCFDVGDVLFGKLRPYLKNILLADFKGVAVGDFWVLRPDKIDTNLLYTLVSSSSFMKVANISAGSKMPRADWNLVSSSYFSIPNSREEQSKIAAYFKSLDSMVLATKKMIAQLKQIKTSSLISMFPQAGEFKPRVRFKGFEGEWEKVKLGTLTEKINRKSGSDSNAPVMMISASSGFIEQSEKYSSDNAGKSLQNYTLLYKGELAYNHGSSKLRQYGSCFELHVEEARIPYVYHCFRMKDGNSTFFAYYLNSGIFDPELRKIVSSTARMDGLLNISYEAYMSIDVYKCSLAEQEKIASFFKSLDKQISIQEQRLEKLKQIKAACLDKMFV